MSSQTRTEIEALLHRFGLSPRHRLGQHFLADRNITNKIVEVAEVKATDQVLEVGAGTGTLTAALGETGARVIAYEIDEGLRPVLESLAMRGNVEFRFEDVMKADFDELVDDGDWKMVANLPYNVGTPLVLDCLRHQPSIVKFVVMLQKEVGERFSAQPGSRDYGLPSVITQIHASLGPTFTVPPQVFVPPPRVESLVLVLDRVEAPEQAERAVEIAATAFRQRRKMLRKSLTEFFVDPNAALRSAGISPTSRPEELSSYDYLELALVT